MTELLTSAALATTACNVSARPTNQVPSRAELRRYGTNEVRIGAADRSHLPDIVDLLIDTYQRFPVLW